MGVCEDGNLPEVEILAEGAGLGMDLGRLGMGKLVCLWTERSGLQKAILWIVDLYLPGYVSVV